MKKKDYWAYTLGSWSLGRILFASFFVLKTLRYIRRHDLETKIFWYPVVELTNQLLNKIKFFFKKNGIDIIIENRIRMGIEMVIKENFMVDCNLELQFSFNFWDELNCISNW